MNIVKTAAGSPIASFDLDGMRLIADLYDQRKFAALVRLASADLQKAANNPDLTIDMKSWVSVRDEQCSVCLAGAVMIGTIALVPNKDDDNYEIVPWNLPKVTPNDPQVSFVKAMCWLNNLRDRQVDDLRCDEITAGKLLAVRLNRGDSPNIPEFVAQLEETAKILEAAGY